MNKEDMVKEVAEQLTTIKAHAESLGKLIDDLQMTVRPTADVTFSALDKSKELLDGFSEAKVAVEKVRRTLKARAQARMKEG